MTSTGTGRRPTRLTPWRSTSTNQPALIYNNQGVSRLARGEAQWAAEHFRQALATDPSFERANTNLQLAEAMLGKSAQTIEASERDSRERARKLNNAGYVAMLQGRPDEARTFYEAALKEHPAFYPQAYQNMMTLNADKAAKAKAASDTAAGIETASEVAQ